MAILSRATLASEAVEAVRTMLLDPDRFQPGQKVSVEELARTLGVSRSPVWSAVARLEAEGLLHVSPRQGVFLVGYDAEKLRSMFEAREALEGMAARLAASRATAAQLGAAEAGLRSGDASLGRADPKGFAAAALAFHAAVAEAAGSPEIGEQLTQLYARTASMCRGRPARVTADDLARNQAQHHAILKAVRNGNGAEAEQAAREHVVRLRTLVTDGDDGPGRQVASVRRMPCRTVRDGADD